MDVQLGKVIHYYDKIGVAVIQATQTIKVGDMIKISGHDKEFNQKIESLQVDHVQVPEIMAGAEGAMKTQQPVKDGDMLYKVPTP